MPDVKKLAVAKAFEWMGLGLVLPAVAVLEAQPTNPMAWLGAAGSVGVGIVLFLIGWQFLGGKEDPNPPIPPPPSG